MIIYTSRYDRLDHFWFTVTHEIGHILLHKENSKTFFIDDLDALDKHDSREREANEFAEGILKCEAILKSFEGSLRPSQMKVELIAADLSLHPGIVAGCLQHHKKANYTSFHELKPKVRPMIPLGYVIKPRRVA